MAMLGDWYREDLAGCLPLCHLRALKSSWSIPVLAEAAHIANYELKIQLWELQGFCVFCPSVKSVSLPPFLPPALAYLLLVPFLSPSKAPEVGGCFHHGGWSVLHSWPVNRYLS